MNKFSKNLKILFVLFFTATFLSGNLSFCRLIIDDCNQSESCCCKIHNHGIDHSVSVSKSCWCEFKHSSAPAEQPQMNALGATKYMSAFQTIAYSLPSNLAGKIFTDQIITFHSPPDKDIYLINLNFRI